MSSKELILTYSFQNEFSLKKEYCFIHESYKGIIKTMREAGCTDTEIARRLVFERNKGRLASYIDDAGNIVDVELYNQALEHCVSYEDLRNGVGAKCRKQIWK